MLRARTPLLIAGVVAALGLPASAAAKSSLVAAQSPQGAAPLSSAPPKGSSSTGSPASSSQLPATGSDAWLIAALGAGMLCTGVGLRLRVADH
jgi:LPXTG-motif cell wall-anchored protein